MNNKIKIFWSFLKTDEGKPVFGLILGVIGCLICWGTHEWVEVTPRHWALQWLLGNKEILHVVNGTPTMGSGLLGLLILMVLKIRGIFSTEMIGNKFSRLLQVIVLITIFATFFSLFIYQVEEYDTWLSGFWEQLKDDLLLFGVCIIAVTTMLFGMKGISKLILLLCLIVIFFDRMNVLSLALGFGGYIAFILFVACFYLQNDFDKQELVSDLTLLYSKTKKNIGSTLNEASDDAQRLGKAASSVASVATGVPVDKMMQDVYSENKNG